MYLKLSLNKKSLKQLNDTLIFINLHFFYIEPIKYFKTSVKKLRSFKVNS